MKLITFTDLRVKGAQPSTHLGTEATSTQGKFPTVATIAPNKAD